MSEFLSWANDIHKRWLDGDENGWGPWFRGHQKAHWCLCPKLYRDYGGYAAVKRNAIEDEIREEFIRRAPVLSASLPHGDEKRAEWEWYFRMQHFGTPTRLLDWTEGALIALYFAVKDNPGFYDAAVWALDPFELNQRVIRRDYIISPSANGVTAPERRKVAPWLPARFTQMAGLPKRAIAIDLTHVVQRISTQHACFTIHGTDETALDKMQDDRLLTKIDIPSFRVQAIKSELRLCGIDEATIFPDLEGLSRSISARWTLGGHKRPPQLEWIKRIPRIGNPDRSRITVNHMERANLSIRLFNRRFTRKTLGYSKCLRNHRLAIALQIAHYNFCRVHSAHKMTPAQAAGLTDHAWTVAELLMASIP